MAEEEKKPVEDTQPQSKGKADDNKKTESKVEPSISEKKELTQKENPEPEGEGKVSEPKASDKKKPEKGETLEEELEEKAEKIAEKEIVEEEVKQPYKRESFAEKIEREEKEKLAAWVPKTKLGKDVKAKKVKDLDEILDNNKKILEEQIIDLLINVKSDLLLMGQSKGKFGGGKRRAWRQTQRKTREGNVPTFSALAVVGDENGHVGIGDGKAMETLPARDKAIRKAKLNIIKIKRSCSDFDCSCSEPHTIPFKVEGKAGSVRVTLIPAPQGTGLVVGNELKKILKLAGIQDVRSKTFGRKRTTFNLIKACIDALKKTNPEVYGK